MKTVTIAFPEKFSHVYSITTNDGVTYINSGYKKASKPHADQSKGLNAQNTTTQGCCNQPTMNQPDMQEEDAK